MDSKIVSRVWWSLALRGALAILFGIVAFFYTGQTLLALVYVFGVFAVLFGILLAGWPRAGAVPLTWLLGIYAIAYGATLLYYAYRLQALRHEAQSLNNVGRRWAAERAHE